MKIHGHWVHDIDPFLIRFPDSWPVPGIFWYGIVYLLSFLLIYGGLFFYVRRGRLALTKDQVGRLLFYLFFGVVLGGRLGYVLLYEPLYFWDHPLETFYLWQGGMASHGGFLGVFFALWLFCHRERVNFLKLLDGLVTLVPLGFFLGRLANFINGEIYGRVTTLPWGVIFPRAMQTDGVPLEWLLPRHPSQLYEAALEGLVLFSWLQFLFWRRSEQPAGRLTVHFLLLYGIFRFFVEFFREPDAPLIGYLTRGQFYSLFLLLAGVALSKYCADRRPSSV